MTLVNLGILITLNVLFHVLGVWQYLEASGYSWGSIFIFCFAWGMGASFLSLLMSKTLVKWTMGVKIVDPRGHMDPALRRVYEMLVNASRQAGLSKVPEFGLYESPELNAFATGATKGSALVAVSTGLLESMREDEVEGVIAHEVAHVANGDMVTMALMQGVVNAIVMFVARIISMVVASRFERDSRYWIQFMVYFVASNVLGILGLMVTNWYSRQREFRADAGGARFAGDHKMIAALKALKNRSQVYDDRAPQLAAFKISGKKSNGLLQLLMTHPPLEQRIEALERRQFS